MVMAQTFDIRFARSAGLAGFLEAPANEYRWKGAGSLSIDAQGISIAVQRGLLSLFARQRSRRITANNLLEIYREGDALRLEFSTAESARIVLPFWVRDSNAGAEIVRLLPTQRSVELEESPSSARRYRFDRRLGALLLAGAVALGFGVLMLQRYSAPPLLTEAGDRGPAGGELIGQTAAPDANQASDVETKTSTGSPRANPGDATRAPAAGTPTGVGVSMPVEPIELDPPALPDPMDSRNTVADPMPVLETVESAYAIHPVIVAVRSPDGVIPIVPGDPAYAAARKELDLFLAELAANRNWWEVTTRIHNNAELDNPALWGLRDIELAISRSHRGSHSAFDRELAERLEARARQFVH
jgi:hypothetical protein